LADAERGPNHLLERACCGNEQDFSALSSIGVVSVEKLGWSKAACAFEQSLRLNDPPRG
jgi:hypothetical protein